jgi:hypothetical protein
MRREIAHLGQQKKFKVPQKWVYAVPYRQTVGRVRQRQDFILVVEKMPLVSDAKNAFLWREKCTKRQLSTLFTLVTKLGMSDSAKAANAAFCHNGSIAFIDTESFGLWPVEYHKLSLGLSLRLKNLWHRLIDRAKDVKVRKAALRMREQLESL